jgi:hypothetical protein
VNKVYSSIHFLLKNTRKTCLVVPRLHTATRVRSAKRNNLFLAEKKSELFAVKITSVVFSEDNVRDPGYSRSQWLSLRFTTDPLHTAANPTSSTFQLLTGNTQQKHASNYV